MNSRSKESRGLLAGFSRPDSVDTSTEIAGFARQSVDAAGVVAGFGGPPAAVRSGPHRDPCRFRTAGRLPTHLGGLFDPPKRPREASQRYHLVFLVLAQDVAHAREGACTPCWRQRLGWLRVVAGFQVSINGRFWLSTEGLFPRPRSGAAKRHQTMPPNEAAPAGRNK